LKNFVERAIDVEFLLDDSNEYINRDSDPDLNLHRVWRRTIKCLDPKMLFDPFEEDFDLPTVLEEQGNGQGWKNKIVGEEDEPTIRFGVEISDSSDRVGIDLRGFGPRKTMI
jgi:hypothetical protein